MKKLDIGNSNFKSLIENNSYYIDKSMFIYDFIESPKQIVLLPRPRRFGKTLNLSMLRHYFDIMQPENEKLFTGLKIWQTETEIKQKRGKYPVIYLSFKDAKSNTWEETFDYIVNEIVKLYLQNDYLLESDILKDVEKQTFNGIISKTANKADYGDSIKALSNYLSRYHNEKVVILVDEYDTPIQAGYKKFYDEVISFMRSLLSGAYKDNDDLYRGAITGILRVSRESLFTGLNNIGVYSILDDRFSKCFGFSEEEVKQFLADFEITTEFEHIRKWYDGYKIGNQTDIYNPWSVLNYVCDHNTDFKPYWVNTSSDTLLKERILERGTDYTREQLLKLINNETIVKDIEENFVFPDLDKDIELLWTLLTFSGYLTTVSKTGRKSYELAIPNFEIKTVFQDIVLNWLKTDLKIKQSTLIETTKYLINNEIPQFEKGFKEIIGDTFS